MTYDSSRRVRRSDDVEEVDAEVPLLSSKAVEPTKPTPLPIRQLLILATVRLAEPIAYTQVSHLAITRIFLLCAYSTTLIP